MPSELQFASAVAVFLCVCLEVCCAIHVQHRLVAPQVALTLLQGSGLCRSQRCLSAPSADKHSVDDSAVLGKLAVLESSSHTSVGDSAKSFDFGLASSGRMTTSENSQTDRQADQNDEALAIEMLQPAPPLHPGRVAYGGDEERLDQGPEPRSSTPGHDPSEFTPSIAAPKHHQQTTCSQMGRSRLLNLPSSQISVRPPKKL